MLNMKKWAYAQNTRNYYCKFFLGFWILISKPDDNLLHSVMEVTPRGKADAKAQTSPPWRCVKTA